MRNEHTIREISKYDDGFSIHTDDNIVFWLGKNHGATPKKGDSVTLYTHGGSFIRGVDLNGQKVFYKSDEQIEKERQEWLENNEKEMQQKFKENKSVMDNQYNNLPDFFKKRIDRFRANSERFRVDYEAYELFCCEQAVLIAEACKTAKAVKSFRMKEWKDQKEQVRGLSDDHSGNSFGISCVLAYHYLLEPENVVKIHGALSPLVGSKEYGDIPKQQEA